MKKNFWRFAKQASLPMGHQLVAAAAFGLLAAPSGLRVGAPSWSRCRMTESSRMTAETHDESPLGQQGIADATLAVSPPLRPYQSMMPRDLEEQVTFLTSRKNVHFSSKVEGFGLINLPTPDHTAGRMGSSIPGASFIDKIGEALGEELAAADAGSQFWGLIAFGIAFIGNLWYLTTHTVKF
eukprot:scaffold106624_cov35-Tisochrysis_lutea.AAC.1